MTPEQRAEELIAKYYCPPSQEIAVAIREAVEAEREACAKIVDELPFCNYDPEVTCQRGSMAAAIRARSQA